MAGMTIFWDPRRDKYKLINILKDISKFTLCICQKPAYLKVERLLLNEMIPWWYLLVYIQDTERIGEFPQTTQPDEESRDNSLSTTSKSTALFPKLFQRMLPKVANYSYYPLQAILFISPFTYLFTQQRCFDNYMHLNIYLFSYFLSLYPVFFPSKHLSLVVILFFCFPFLLTVHLPQVSKVHEN